MKQSFYALYVLAMLVILPHSKAFSQQVFSSDSLVKTADKFLQSVAVKSLKVDKLLSLQTHRYVKNLLRHEKKLEKKLRKRDPLVAKFLFKDVADEYEALQQKLNGTSHTNPIYIGHLDTLSTAIRFIGQYLDRGGKIKDVNANLQQLRGLQTRFTQAEEIGQLLRKRSDYLHYTLQKFGMLKDLRKMQRQVFYYRQQVEAYRALIKDPVAIESRALSLLQKMPACKKFFSEHAHLAMVFRSSEHNEQLAGEGIPGLQTRVENQKMLSDRYGSENIAERSSASKGGLSQPSLTSLKLVAKDLKKSAGPEEFPDFKPNSQKTKSWKKRLVIGSNLQTVKGNYFFPSTTDIGLSFGYKINDKSIAGIGASYKVGMEKQAKHIYFSNQGIGLRSFVDYKMKGGFWLSGGAEMNYRSRFKDFDVLQNYSAWQKSAVLGLSRKQKLGAKLQANAQIYYDFLAKSQVPRTQPLVFRIGYSLR